MAALFALLLMLGGCGGGGGSDDDGGGDDGGGTSQTVLIQGRVTENNTAQAVAGATVRYGSITATTDGSGNFSFQAPPSGATALTVVGPNLPNGQAAYRDEGYIGTTIYNLRAGGFPVPATTAGATVNIGTVRLFSVDFPPPPPPI